MNEALPDNQNLSITNRPPSSYNKRPVRQIIRFSNYSLCITLPKEFVDQLNWHQGDRINFQLNPQSKQLILSENNSKPLKILPPMQTASPKLKIDDLEPILPIQ